MSEKNISASGLFSTTLIIGGIVGIIYFLQQDTTVPTSLGRVNNFGLMQDKQNGLTISSVVLFIGIILAIFTGKSSSSNSEKTKKCPFCAEEVKLEAKVCKHCQRDITMVGDACQTSSSPVHLDNSIMAMREALKDTSYDKK